MTTQQHNGCIVKGEPALIPPSQDIKLRYKLKYIFTKIKFSIAFTATILEFADQF